MKFYKLEFVDGKGQIYVFGSRIWMENSPQPLHGRYQGKKGSYCLGMSGYGMQFCQKIFLCVIGKPGSTAWQWMIGCGRKAFL